MKKFEEVMGANVDHFLLNSYLDVIFCVRGIHDCRESV